MKRTDVPLPDALRDALGQIVANERREWRRERELIEAQARAAIAELRAENVALLARIDEAVATRLAALRDGVDGVAGRDGADGADGQPGRDGVDGASGRDGLDGAKGLDGRDGNDGRDGASVTEDQVAAAVETYLTANPPPAGRDGSDGRDGVDGQDGAPGRDGIDGASGRDGIDGTNGRDGERGPEGAPGKLPVIRAWSDRVHYEGEAITHDGSTWQAHRDTGHVPPHEDWRCIATAGANGIDGRSMTIRGTWDEAATYQHLDIVALNGASFAARHDEPGPCPGEGWQMIAAQGKRGQPGETGRTGLRGEPGPVGPAVAALDVDNEGMFRLTNADGSVVSHDLYPLLSRIARP